MNVLHIIAGLAKSSGGPSQFLVGLAKSLAVRGVGVRIVTGRTRWDAMTEVGDLFVEVIPFRGINTPWRYSAEFGRAIRRAVSEVELVHNHGLWLYPNYVAMRAALDQGKPIVVSPHGALNEWASHHHWLRKAIYGTFIERKALNTATAIHAVSHGEAKAIAAWGVKAPIVTIPSGVSPAYFDARPTKDTLDRQYPFLVGKVVVLFMGRLHPVKGLDTLVRGFSLALQRQPNLFLLVVGPGQSGYVRRLKSELDDWGAGGKYHFAGIVDAEPRLAALARADLFVLPSFSEGLPMAALEAMACGLPVVLSRACNMEEVSEYGAGLIIETREIEVANALVRLGSDSALRSRMGSAGHSLVLQTYTSEKSAQAMYALYERILGGIKTAQGQDTGSRRAND